MTTGAEREIAKDLKEQVCYVAEDYVTELSRVNNCDVTLEEQYTLPDGGVITVGSERFRSTESLFQPRVLGRDHEGVQHAVFESLRKVSNELKPQLLSNVVLSGKNLALLLLSCMYLLCFNVVFIISSGGNTLFPGFTSRLERELSLLCGDKLSRSIRVVSPEERRYLVFQGGCILANTASFLQQWVSKQEYDEFGPSIVHKKCF